MYQMVVKNVVPNISKEKLEQQVNQKISNILKYESLKPTQPHSDEL